MRMALGCPKPYPVAMIPYVNMLPFRMLGPPPHCCWHDYVPRDSVAALRTGKVMAAAVPVGALPALEDCVAPLGHYGIAARESSMSVLFFSARPFDQIRIDDRMQLTTDSATSVRLLYLLLNCRQPPGAEHAGGASHDPVGELIIGDRAMQQMHAWRCTKDGNGSTERMRARYLYVTDLATCWYAAYGRPFVFARWVIRRDAPSAVRTILMDWLAKFDRHEDALVCRSIPLAAQRLGLPEAWLEEYYQCLRRVLQAEDLEGQALFLKEIRRNQIDCLVQPALSGEYGAGPSLMTGIGRLVPNGPKVAPHVETSARLRRPVLRQREAS